eukprot:SAG25_NODE_7552_length_473_cov_1.382353_2_plen_26_part_01
MEAEEVLRTGGQFRLEPDPCWRGKCA